MIPDYPSLSPRQLKDEIEPGDIIRYRLNERVEPIPARVIATHGDGRATVMIAGTDTPYIVEGGEWQCYEPCPLYTPVIHHLGFADDEEEAEWGYCVHHFHLMAGSGGCHFVLAREEGRWVLYACREKDGEAVCEEYTGFWNVHELQQLLRRLESI